MDENELVEYEVIPENEVSLRTVALGMKPAVLIEVHDTNIKVTVAGIDPDEMSEALAAFGTLLTNTNVEVSDEGEA